MYNCNHNSLSSVTINSVDQYGNSIFGYYTVLFDSSGGNVLATGFTTRTLATTSGQSYWVQADSCGSCAFSHWSDGVTSNPRSFTANDDASFFTAVYNCGGTSTITISTANSGGKPIYGYSDVTLWQNGAQLANCFSMCSFAVNNGQSYQVMAASYSSETFNYWTNDGSTGAETVNVPNTSTTISLTAVYSP